MATRALRGLPIVTARSCLLRSGLAQHSGAWLRHCQTSGTVPPERFTDINEQSWVRNIEHPALVLARLLSC